LNQERVHARTGNALREKQAAAGAVLSAAGPGWEKFLLQTEDFHTLGGRGVGGLRGGDGGFDVVVVEGEALNGLGS
jgi:hypothetical protein